MVLDGSGNCVEGFEARLSSFFMPSGQIGKTKDLILCVLKDLAKPQC